MSQPSDFTCSIMNLIASKEDLQTKINQHQLIVSQMDSFLALCLTTIEVKNPAKDFLTEVKFELDNLLAKRRKIDMQIAELLENQNKRSN